MERKTEKTTILFVNKNSRALKPLQVSSQLILHWRKYVAALILIFFSLISSVIYLTSNIIHQNKIQRALTMKVHAGLKEFEKIDTSALRKKFTKIDKELSVINYYLKARGVQPGSKEPQGGEMEDNTTSPEETADFYERYLNRITYNISYTPLGFPFSGSVTSSFGHRENPFGGSAIETHKGLDIKGPMGATVKAMAKGTVAFAGTKGGFGNCVILKHGNGFETLYGHLSKIGVTPGQTIDIGQEIGNIGSTGRSTGPHLHYEVHQYGQKINPESFLTLN